MILALNSHSKIQLKSTLPVAGFESSSNGSDKNIVAVNSETVLLCCVVGVVGKLKKVVLAGSVVPVLSKILNFK